MKRYPLQTLLRLREHRTDAARMLVLERQRAVQACRDACTQIEAEIRDLGTSRTQHRLRLLEPPPPGIDWASAMSQRESHVELLDAHIAAARQRLAQAEQALRESEKLLAQARDAFFRAKARQDALEKRKDSWRGEQFVIEARAEEAASEDLQSTQRIRVGE